MPRTVTPTIEPPVSGRLMSVDALRGFDMFWIIGANVLVYVLDHMRNGSAAKGGGGDFSLIGFLAGQLDHAFWEGFHFYDLIYPLFIFIVGVSLVFSLTKMIRQEGRAEALRRVFRRGILLFVVGLLERGGFSHSWPDIRLTGVINRIALCYLFTGLIFCFCNVRAMIAICAALLVGYWAVMTFVPIRAIQLEKASLQALAKKAGTDDPKILFQQTTQYVTGHFEHGYNLANHFDFQYLPGRKYDTYYDAEGYLSTFPAIATCLLGVFAGLLLRHASILDREKVVFLLAAGVMAVSLGWVWNLQFPVIKKIWTSSFVLVAGGYSAALLGVFYLIVDVWKCQKWCQPFVWLGMNSITIYVTNNIIGGFPSIARRMVGGEIKTFFDEHLHRGSGEMIIAALGLALAFWFVHFLYQRKIFLRL